MNAALDKLQVKLQTEVFHYAQDSKKAAGRFLGTIVELITYYKICSWGFSKYLLIEKSIPEFGRPDITHNVEFSLHPMISEKDVVVPVSGKGISAVTLGKIANFEPRLAVKLLSTKNVLRNSAIVGRSSSSTHVANLFKVQTGHVDVVLSELDNTPVAIFECKRVGVEEGMKKGPQSIEKAKQGAYVARSVSALQKVIDKDGNVFGFLPDAKTFDRLPNYYELISGIASGTIRAPEGFIMTVGVVSNHGNWFTSSTMNKELKVLAAAYDWLLFLTDEGMVRFVDDCIINPSAARVPIRDAFLASYNGSKKGIRFTKTQLSLDADQSLRSYFVFNGEETDKWFSVLTPTGGDLPTLSEQLINILKRESSER